MYQRREAEDVGDGGVRARRQQLPRDAGEAALRRVGERRRAGIVRRADVGADGKGLGDGRGVAAERRLQESGIDRPLPAVRGLLTGLADRTAGQQQHDHQQRHRGHSPVRPYFAAAARSAARSPASMFGRL